MSLGDFSANKYKAELFNYQDNFSDLLLLLLAAQTEIS